MLWESGPDERKEMTITRESLVVVVAEKKSSVMGIDSACTPLGTCT